jgi:hypothetical protein
MRIIDPKVSFVSLATTLSRKLECMNGLADSSHVSSRLGQGEQFSPTTVEKINALRADDLGYVVEWMCSSGTPVDEAKTCREEFLQFASLHFADECLLNEVPLVVPSKADEFLHTFLLFNGEFTDWCNRHFGALLKHFPGRAPEGSWTSTVHAMASYFGLSGLAAGTSSATIGNPPTAIWVALECKGM